MNSNETLTGVRVKNGSQTLSAAAADVGVGEQRRVLTVIGGASLAIGMWAVAALIAAMVNHGGPIALITGWLTGVIG